MIFGDNNNDTDLYCMNNRTASHSYLGGVKQLREKVFLKNTLWL